MLAEKIPCHGGLSASRGPLLALQALPRSLFVLELHFVILRGTVPFFYPCSWWPEHCSWSDIARSNSRMAAKKDGLETVVVQAGGGSEKSLRSVKGNLDGLTSEQVRPCGGALAKLGLDLGHAG